MNSVDGWYFYNHAILPEARPTEAVDASILNDKSVWKKENWGGGRHYLPDGQVTLTAKKIPVSGIQFVTVSLT